jgi:2-aminobenzoate-CoA ligase
MTEVQPLVAHDRYPSSTIPLDWLVTPDRQPRYLAGVGAELGPDANVGDALSDAHVRDGRGERVAAIHAGSGRQLTFSQLSTESTRLAIGLVELGLQPGDRIAFRSANSPEMLIVAVAIWKAGGVVVPTPIQARETELRHLLDDTGTTMIFAAPEAGTPAIVDDAVRGTYVREVITFGPGDVPAMHRSWRDVQSVADGSKTGGLPRVEADGIAVLWHTGGTTGPAKGCYHTHRRYLMGGYALAEAIGIRAGDRWGAAAPVGHALGFLCYTSFSLLHGATAVFIEDFRDPRAVVESISRYRIDTFASIAATWAAMLEQVDADPSLDVSSIRRSYAMWQSASTSDLADRWAARGVRLQNNFGSTAFASWVIVPPVDAECAPSALGRPTPGYVIAVVDPETGVIAPPTVPITGQMAVQGPTGLTYWRRPELQEREVRDGWTVVDDLVGFDDVGYLHYRGRTDFLISSAGYKIAPVEVEEVLAMHPAVREVGVIGVPDEDRGEIVAALIALRDGTDGDDALVRELQDHVKANLAPYKYPRRVIFVDEIPRDPVGKVQPRTLRTIAVKASVS